MYKVILLLLLSILVTDMGYTQKVSFCALLLVTVLTLTSASPIKSERKARGLSGINTTNLTTKFRSLIDNLNEIQVTDCTSLHIILYIEVDIYA